MQSSEQNSSVVASLDVDEVKKGAGDESQSKGIERGFVAMSRFAIANGMIEEVRRAFIERPHLVDDAPGFVRMEVLSPQDAPEEIWLLTFWSDRESFERWHRHHLHDSHQSIPKGLRLIPSKTEQRYFDHVSS